MATLEKSYRAFFSVQVFFSQGLIRRRGFYNRSQSYNDQHRSESPALREKTSCQERNLNEHTACHAQSWFDSQGPAYGQNLQKAKRLLRNECFLRRSTAICPKGRLFDRTKKEGTSILL